MKKKIEQLTAEQEAKFSEYVQRWTRVGLSTEPANRTAAEEGIRRAYIAAGLKTPERIVWCTSPMAMVLTHAILKSKLPAAIKSDVRASVWASVWDSVRDSVRASVGDSVRASVGASVWASVRDSVRASVWDSVGDSVRASVGDSVWASVWDSVRDSVWASVWDSVGDSVWDSVRASVRASVYGQHDANWLSFYSYFREVCGLKDETEPMLGLFMQAENAGWWLPCGNVCFVAERHTTVKLDEQGRLHCEDGAAVQYPDGWGVYAWYGVRVPEQVIAGTLTFEQIMAEENAEIKRVMIEKFGEGAFVEALGVQPIDVSEWGSLYRVDYDDDEPLVLVRVVDPSTDRVYYNQCPPVDDDGRKMVRAKQAVAWRFGMREEEYMPLLQA